MKLQKSLLLASGILFFTAVAAVQFLDYRQAECAIAENLLEVTRHIRALLMTTRQVYQQQLPDSDLPLPEQTPDPLPARISEGLRNWTEDGLFFNSVSDRPRNPDNAAGPLETEAIDYFREHREA